MTAAASGPGAVVACQAEPFLVPFEIILLLGAMQLLIAGSTDFVGPRTLFVALCAVHLLVPLEIIFLVLALQLLVAVNTVPSRL